MIEDETMRSPADDAGGGVIDWKSVLSAQSDLLAAEAEKARQAAIETRDRVPLSVKALCDATQSKDLANVLQIEAVRGHRGPVLFDHTTTDGIQTRVTIELPDHTKWGLQAQSNASIRQALDHISGNNAVVVVVHQRKDQTTALGSEAVYINDPQTPGQLIHYDMGGKTDSFVGLVPPGSIGELLDYPKFTEITPGGINTRIGNYVTDSLARLAPAAPATTQPLPAAS